MLPIDAHVHFHRRRWVAPTLAAATGHFRGLALPRNGGPLGALLLAQSAREQVFEWLRDQQCVGTWRIDRVEAEPQSLRLASPGAELLVICGRQIVAEAGLEVLALGTDVRIANGLGLERTLEAARDAGAMPVLPWGFGKWLGRRGRRLRTLLTEQSGQSLWLGDNGGRLRGLRRPKLFDQAEAQHFGILPGTDPFPFGRDYRRVGSFGCVVAVTDERSRPWQSIATRLASLRASPQSYGNTTGLLAFGVKQAWIQVHMRLQGRSK